MTKFDDRSDRARQEVRSRFHLWLALALILGLIALAAGSAKAESEVEISSARWFDLPVVENDRLLDGPHGMHAVNDPDWIKSDGGWHKTFAQDRSDGDLCAAGHGKNHLGTRLSRVPVDRQLRDADGKLLASVKAGETIACDLCHELQDSFEN